MLDMHSICVGHVACVGACLFVGSATASSPPLKSWKKSVSTRAMYTPARHRELNVVLVEHSFQSKPSSSSVPSKYTCVPAAALIVPCFPTTLIVSERRYTPAASSHVWTELLSSVLMQASTLACAVVVGVFVDGSARQFGVTQLGDAAVGTGVVGVGVVGTVVGTGVVGVSVGVGVVGVGVGSGAATDPVICKHCAAYWRPPLLVPTADAVPFT